MDMEVLLNYYPVMKNLCAKLHYNDIKALSSLSHIWWDGMETIIVNRSIFRPFGIDVHGKSKSPSKVKRAYKNMYICNDLELLDVLRNPEEIVSLTLRSMRVRNLEDISKFTLTGITELSIEYEHEKDNFMPELVRTVLGQNNGISKLVFTGMTNIDTLIDISEVRLNKLKEFHLLHCANVDLNKLEVFIRNHHNLKDCSFLGVRGITALKNILSPLSNLRSLGLTDDFDDLTIITFIAEHMPNLTTLIISFESTPVFNNQTFQNANFKELKSLKLKFPNIHGYQYDDISDDADNFLCSIFAPKLESFFMNSFCEITEKYFSHLVQNSPLIRRLEFQGKFWEHSTLVNSIKQLKQLQFLNIMGSDFGCSFDEALIEELIWKTCIYECKTIPVSNFEILKEITSVRTDFKCLELCPLPYCEISNGSREFIFCKWRDPDDDSPYDHDYYSDYISEDG